MAKKTTFVMRDGPLTNTYIAPSGTTYRVRKGEPFDVGDDADAEYFSKKDTFDKISSSQAKKEVRKQEEEKEEEAEKDTAESGFEKGSAPEKKEQEKTRENKK